MFLMLAMAASCGALSFSAIEKGRSSGKKR